jgi:hypothetical protein
MPATIVGDQRVDDRRDQGFTYLGRQRHACHWLRSSDVALTPRRSEITAALDLSSAHRTGAVRPVS